MISVEEAQQYILRNTPVLSCEQVELSDAGGRVLSEHIRTDRPVPPYHRVMMDGIAIASKAWKGGRRSFGLQEGVQAAGTVPLKLASAQQAIEVMTGAVLPAGTDCVVPYEELEITDQTATITGGSDCRPWRFVHRKGSDAPRARVILKAGTYLKSPHVAIAASVGVASLSVYCRPKIGIVATGDELVQPGKPVEAHQIYLSNSYALQSALSGYGFDDIQLFHCSDDKRALTRAIKKILSRCDVLLLSGGVSKGKYDYVREVLQNERVREIFYRVRQRPGKPLWFGATEKQQLVFALPGNPVSVLVCCYQYVLPALFAMVGQQFEGIEVICSADIGSPVPALTNFVPVHANQRLEVTPVDVLNSGDFLALSGSDGFVRIPANQSVVKKGQRVKFTPWSLL